MAGRPVGWTPERDAFLRTLMGQTPMPSGAAIARMFKKKLGVSMPSSDVWIRIRQLRDDPPEEVCAPQAARVNRGRVKGAKDKKPRARSISGWSDEKNEFLLKLMEQPEGLPSGRTMSVIIKEKFGDYHSPDSVWSQVSRLRKEIAEEKKAEAPAGNVPPAFKALIDRINHWHRTGESALPIHVDPETKARMGKRALDEIQSW